jgi:hypothetical protein
MSDAPLGGRESLLGVWVHRLFCDNSECARRTFANRCRGSAVGLASGGRGLVDTAAGRRGQPDDAVAHGEALNPPDLHALFDDAIN